MKKQSMKQIRKKMYFILGVLGLVLVLLFNLSLGSGKISAKETEDTTRTNQTQLIAQDALKGDNDGETKLLHGPAIPTLGDKVTELTESNSFEKGISPVLEGSTRAVSWSDFHIIVIDEEVTDKATNFTSLDEMAAYAREELTTISGSSRRTGYLFNNIPAGKDWFNYGYFTPKAFQPNDHMPTIEQIMDSMEIGGGKKEQTYYPTGATPIGAYFGNHGEPNWLPGSANAITRGFANRSTYNSFKFPNNYTGAHNWGNLLFIWVPGRKVLPLSVELKKYQEDGKTPLAGAEFEFQSKKSNGTWEKFTIPNDTTAYTTNASGEIKLTQGMVNAIKQSGGTSNALAFRFAETKAPAGYVQPTGDKSAENYAFATKAIEITKDTVDTITFELTNKKVDTFKIEFKKTDADTNAPIPGAKFRVESLKKATGNWGYFGPSMELTTDSKGEIIINENTNKEYYDSFKNYSGGTNDTKFRFKELTPASGYQLPAEPYSNEVEWTTVEGTKNFAMTNKKIPPLSVTLKKYQEDGKTALAGAEFEFQSKKSAGKWEKFAISNDTNTYTTNASGEINFNQAMLDTIKYYGGKIGNEAFRFVETKAPTGYVQPTGDKSTENYEFATKPIVITKDTEGEVVFEFTNKKLPDTYPTIKLKKVNESNQPLANAKFVMQALRSNSTWTKYQLAGVQGRTFTTNSNGEIVIENAAWLKEMADDNITLRLREYEAPTGYIQPPSYNLSTNVAEERNSAAGFTAEFKVVKNAQNISVTVTNKKRPFDITIEKKGSDGPLLSGAEFKIEYKSGNNWLPENGQYKDKVFTTNASGRIVVEADVLIWLASNPSATYRFVETKTPTGYEGTAYAPTSNGFTPGSLSGSQTWTVINQKTVVTPPLAIKITKVDSENANLKLSGAQFQLQRYMTNGWQNETSITPNVFTTNSSGEIIIPQNVLDQLNSTNNRNREYSYRFIETKAPVGYDLPTGNDGIAGGAYGAFKPESGGSLNYIVRNKKTVVQNGVVTIYLRDEAGKNITAYTPNPIIKNGNVGQTWTETPPMIPGYTFKSSDKGTSGTFTAAAQTIVYTYTEIQTGQLDWQVDPQLDYGKVSVPVRNDTIVPRQETDWGITIKDTRSKVENWAITAKMQQDLQASSGQVIKDIVKFKNDQDQKTYTMTTNQATPIYQFTSPAAAMDKKITWKQGEGFYLDLKAYGDYPVAAVQGVIEFTLSTGP